MVSALTATNVEAAPPTHTGKETVFAPAMVTLTSELNLSRLNVPVATVVILTAPAAVARLDRFAVKQVATVNAPAAEVKLDRSTVDPVVFGVTVNPAAATKVLTTVTVVAAVACNTVTPVAGIITDVAESKVTELALIVPATATSGKFTDVVPTTVPAAVV